MREDFTDEHMAWCNGGRRRVYAVWKISTNTVDGYETDTKCAHSVHGRPTQSWGAFSERVGPQTLRDLFMSEHLWVNLNIISSRNMLFSVFTWRHHIPKLKITFPSGVLVVSDKRSYRTLTFHNVLSRQGSSFCNRTRLKFQAFALRDT